MSATIRGAGSAATPTPDAKNGAGGATAAAATSAPSKEDEGEILAKTQRWQIKHQENTIRWLAVGTTIGFFALIVLLLLLSYRTGGAGGTGGTGNGGDANAGYKAIVQTLAGVVGTGWATIVSFYFGSSVGSRQQSQTINTALQTAWQGQGSGSGDTPDASQLTQKISAIAALAEAAHGKLAGLGAPTVEDMAAELAQVPGGAPAAASAALEQARKDLAAMTAQAAACATDADRAKVALADIGAAAGDTAKLAAVAARVRQLDLDSAGASHDFTAALADFTDARERVLKLVAQG